MIVTSSETFVFNRCLKKVSSFDCWKRHGEYNVDAYIDVVIMCLYLRVNVLKGLWERGIYLKYKIKKINKKNEKFKNIKKKIYTGVRISVD